MIEDKLKQEIEDLIEKSGYEKSKSMLCPIVKIVSMRYKNVSHKEIVKVFNEIL